MSVIGEAENRSPIFSKPITFSYRINREIELYLILFGLHSVLSVYHPKVLSSLAIFGISNNLIVFDLTSFDLFDCIEILNYLNLLA